MAERRTSWPLVAALALAVLAVAAYALFFHRSPAVDAPTTVTEEPNEAVPAVAADPLDAPPGPSVPADLPPPYTLPPTLPPAD